MPRDRVEIRLEMFHDQKVQVLDDGVSGADRSWPHAQITWKNLFAL